MIESCKNIPLAKKRIKWQIVLGYELHNFMFNTARIGHENTYDMREHLPWIRGADSWTCSALLAVGHQRASLACRSERVWGCSPRLKILFADLDTPGCTAIVSPITMYAQYRTQVHQNFKIKTSTQVVSIFIANSCVIKQELTKPHSPNYCHFMPFYGMFIFLHYSIIPINMPSVGNQDT